MLAFWNRQTQLLQAIDNWQQRGLLEADIAEPLRDDVQRSKPTRSFSSLALLLGVICLALGAMTFVASNWEDMASRTKVILLLSCLLASWAAALYFHVRQMDWAKHAFVLLACALFGASIMLLGQIYHMQGDVRDAVWLWAFGALFASVLTRSVPALMLTVLLFGLWGVWGAVLSIEQKQNPDYSFLVYLALCGASAWWMRSNYVGHLCLIVLSAWGFCLSIGALLVSSLGIEIFHIGLAFSLLLLPIMLISDSLGQKLFGFERPALLYLFLFAIGVFSAWYVMLNQNKLAELARITQLVVWPFVVSSIVGLVLAGYSYFQKLVHRYDVFVSVIFVIGIQALVAVGDYVPFLHEAVLLASTVWMIRMGWRLGYTPLSRLGFVVFMAIMLLIYAVTVGSLIGTSGFYLGAGALILIAVFLGRRFAASKEAVQ